LSASAPISMKLRLSSVRSAMAFAFGTCSQVSGTKSFAFRVHLDAVASMHERRRIAVTRRRDGARIELIHIDEQRLNLFGQSECSRP